MAAHDSAQPAGRFFNGPTLLLASAFLLPGIVPSLFGWLTGLLAIPVFCLLIFYGTGQGSIFVRNGALLAVAGAIPLKLLPTVLFSLTLVPLAYSFNMSAAAGESEWRTGARGSLVLGASWLIFWAGYGALEGINPYVELLRLLDAVFAQTYEYYRVNADLPAENLLRLEQAMNELRVIFPRILPGLLVSTVILTVWLNLVASVRFIARFRPGRLPWQKYSQWRLPDRIVWLAIGSGAALMFTTGILRDAAVCVVITCGLLYFFQGLAVFIHLLDKWNVPLYLRIVIYGVLILQSYGLLLLTIIGLADVWVNFRHRQNSDNQHGNGLE